MYIRAIWYIFGPFGNLEVYFGILNEEKSGNPGGSDEKLALKEMKGYHFRRLNSWKREIFFMAPVRSQDCQIVLDKIYPKRGKMYQITTKYQMALKYTKCPKYDHKISQHAPLQGPLKFTQIGIFGMKIYHLATLVRTFRSSV
jgi:hypothetical protein